MDAIAALFLQEDKENIPPYPAAVAGGGDGDCKPTTAAGPPPPKKFFRRIHRQRIPLADITNLFRGSDQMGERVVVGVERVSGKKRKSPEDGGSSGGDEVDTTSFCAVSRRLRFGFR